MKTTIHTKNKRDLRSLLGLLFANGYGYHGKTVDVDKCMADYSTYHTLSIDPEENDYVYEKEYAYKYFCGNQYTLSENASFRFPEDTVDILEYISTDNDITIEDVGDYDAVISRDKVTVGCQTIPYEKFQEIVKAFDKLRK